MDRLLPAALLLAGLPAALAQSSCSLPSLSMGIATPSMADGYAMRLVATGLSRPRGIIFDHNDRLLVVEQRQGISALTLNDQGGNCIGVSSTDTVVDDSSVRLRRG
jgi:hypothetical protein